MKKFSVYLLFEENAVVNVEAQECALVGEEYRFIKSTPNDVVLRVPSGNVHYILISEISTED